jgi:hypothetical protein
VTSWFSPSYFGVLFRGIYLIFNRTHRAIYLSFHPIYRSFNNIITLFVIYCLIVSIQ